MAIRLSITIADATQPGCSTLDRMSTGELDELIAGDTRLFVNGATLQHTVDSLAAKSGNKANSLFCKASKPLVVHIALIKSDNAAFGKAEPPPCNHIVFIAVTQGDKLGNIARVIQTHAAVYISSIAPMASPRIATPP